jgi:hypothetical protein
LGKVSVGDLPSTNAPELLSVRGKLPAVVRLTPSTQTVTPTSRSKTTTTWCQAPLSTRVAGPYAVRETVPS